METIFNVIISNLVNKMPFKPLFEDLGDVDMHSERKLEYLMYSAYCFYFDGDIVHTKEALSNLINCNFDGDYNKWTWVEGGIMLQLYLDGFNNTDLKDKVLATLDYGNDESKNRIKRKAFIRRTHGQLLHKDENSTFVNDKKIVFLKLIPYFCELLFIKTFGDGEEFTEPQLMFELTSLEKKVKDVISIYR